MKTHKILFAMRSLAHFSYISSVVEALDTGHKIELLLDRGWSRFASDKVVIDFTHQANNVKAYWAVRRKGHRWIFPLREIRSYISYVKRKDQSFHYLKRWNGYLPKRLRKFLYFRPVRFLLSQFSIYELLTAIERLVPPSKKVVADLLKRKPDVVVATPMNLRFSEEVEYVKAAKALGIPTVVLVLSWDNLTTKGVFHVIPDLILVWNAQQRNEAITIHGVPENKIAIMGSPFFDKWFDRDFEDQGAFCRDKFFVYLGSSANITKDEPKLVQRFYNALKKDPRTSKLCMLVRPHPANPKHFCRLVGEDLIVWPPDGALPEDYDSQQDFHNALTYCEFVVGINTSGMIDAIIHDKPCLTILIDKYQDTQEKAVHFKQLFPTLDVNRSFQEAINSIADLLDGKDKYREQRREFVKKFIRPNGVSAGKVAATEITGCANYS